MVPGLQLVWSWTVFWTFSCGSVHILIVILYVQKQSFIVGVSLWNNDIDHNAGLHHVIVLRSKTRQILTYGLAESRSKNVESEHVIDFWWLFAGLNSPFMFVVIKSHVSAHTFLSRWLLYVLLSAGATHIQREAPNWWDIRSRPSYSNRRTRANLPRSQGAQQEEYCV